MAMEKSSEQALRDVLDKQQIREVLYRYCRSMDRVDDELGYSVFHADAQADYGHFYSGSGHGFIDFARQLHRNEYLEHSHQITNILIVVQGDRAESEAYVTVSLRRRDAGQLRQVTLCGRYLDKWTRKEGRWAISRRDYVHDFDDIRPIVEAVSAGWGKRDSSDLSYSLSIATSHRNTAGG
jgi:SnoaL-like domain